MVTVMMFLSTSVFLWTLSQSTMYNEAVKVRSQEETDRHSENVVASGRNYSVSGDAVTVNVELKNAGSVAVQLISLWVLDTNQSNQKFDSKSINLNLNPGDVLNLVESSETTVTITGADPSHDFVSWFVTARGNTISVEREEEVGGVIVSQVAQGIGYLAMDFDKFRYFEYDSDYELKNFTTGSGGYSVPSDEFVVFGVDLANFDPSGGERSLTLNSHSLLWMYFPTYGVERIWFIVNVNASGTIQPVYSDVTIAYGQRAVVYFASKTDGSISPNDKVKPLKSGPAAINLLLLGAIGSSEYGQNIPFVSVHCS